MVGGESPTSHTRDGGVGGSSAAARYFVKAPLSSLTIGLDVSCCSCSLDDIPVFADSETNEGHLANTDDQASAERLSTIMQESMHAASGPSGSLDAVSEYFHHCGHSSSSNSAMSLTTSCLVDARAEPVPHDDTLERMPFVLEMPPKDIVLAGSAQIDANSMTELAVYPID